MLLVTRHEAVHSLDLQHQICAGDIAPDEKVKDGIEEQNLKDLHAWIEENHPAFFKVIVEENFLHVEFPAGHPQDHEMELLASLISSLFHPTWEQQVKMDVEKDLALPQLTANPCR